VQTDKPGVSIVVGALLAPMHSAQPNDVVFLIHPRRTAVRGHPQAVDQWLGYGEDPPLPLWRSWCDSPQLTEPRMINVAEIHAQPRHFKTQILGQAAERGPCSAVHRHGAGTVPADHGRCAGKTETPSRGTPRRRPNGELRDRGKVTAGVPLAQLVIVTAT
jgi:hypothetical protein